MSNRIIPRFSLLLLLLLALGLPGCAEAQAPLSPGTQESPETSASFLGVALDHFARGAEGRLLFDPRPLRAGAAPRLGRAPPPSMTPTPPWPGSAPVWRASAEST